VTKLWDVSVAPIHDADGRPKRLFSVSRDGAEERWASVFPAVSVSFGKRLRKLCDGYAGTVIVAGSAG
jgi:hypothetical protein